MFRTVILPLMILAIWLPFGCSYRWTVLSDDCECNGETCRNSSGYEIVHSWCNPNVWYYNGHHVELNRIIDKINIFCVHRKANPVPKLIH